MILVTGGTGLIGSHLLFQLLKEGKNIRACYRSKKSIDTVLKVFGYYTNNPAVLLEKIDWVQADITDIISLEAIFKDIQYVYHCAAMISFDPKNYTALVKNNIEGTANIVNLCIENNIKKLCYVSTIAAIGPSVKNKQVDEDSEWNDVNVSVYGLTKHEAELEVWRGSQEGLAIVIVNPGVVLGPGFWHTGSGTFFKYAAKGKKTFIPGGTGFVSVTDVTTSMIKLMESDVERERFILVNENMSYEALFQKISSFLNVTAPSKKIPFWVLECFWRLDWLRSNFLGKRRRLTKNMVKGFYKLEIYSNKKLKSTINIQFEDLNETIHFCCSKYLT
ncbi:NAD-dependent epimerase/dehydratase family protein [Flagellimonas sp. 389]|uniref:NAD-dependent epimerase/dehydratase family protein n=1 Tax=Flagellimonas sp. 389 TaxID=2835862 RepID=UPI001BD5E8AC|nr:NAD-dependent epimerase/dehydratase family protein [Flagellimonas sp. 389]MBS9462384.1 NAD-dependent epimerase/dehydratase family protein [Flagellimonas sp. 389]